MNTGSLDSPCLGFFGLKLRYVFTIPVIHTLWRLFQYTIAPVILDWQEQSKLTSPQVGISG